MDTDLIISFASGVIITLICSLLPFIRSSQQLDKEAKELRRLSTLILRGLENSDLVSLNRDDKGNIIGLIIELQSKLSSQSSMKADLTIQRNE